MGKQYCTGLKNAPENINSCCYQHDRDYGINGKVSRAEADKRLRACLISQGRPVFAWCAWVAVRCFGWMFYKRKNNKSLRFGGFNYHRLLNGASTPSKSFFDLFSIL